MSVIDGTDKDLRSLLYQKHCVAVKYHSSSCERCKAFRPIFDALSRKSKYADILFVRMNADENPVAKKFINDRDMPFMGIYNNGLLLESTTVGSEEAITVLLDKLLAHQQG